MRFTEAQQRIWHDMAVGLYYREETRNLVDTVAYASVVHWDHLSLATKLRWQAAAKSRLENSL